MSDTEWECGYYDAYEEFRAKRGEWAQRIEEQVNRLTACSNGCKEVALHNQQVGKLLLALAGEIRGGGEG